MFGHALFSIASIAFVFIAPLKGRYLKTTHQRDEINLALAGNWNRQPLVDQESIKSTFLVRNLDVLRSFSLSNAYTVYVNIFVYTHICMHIIEC